MAKQETLRGWTTVDPTSVNKATTALYEKLVAANETAKKAREAFSAELEKAARAVPVDGELLVQEHEGCAISFRWGTVGIAAVPKKAATNTNKSAAKFGG